jgi:transketolase
MNISAMESLRWDLRRDIVDIIIAGGGGHIGGDMSVVDALMVLYENHLRITPESASDPARDRFILSKGHSMEAYYAVLAHKGFLNLEDIKARFSKFNSPYIGHPNNKLPGIEMNTGSLGHGLSVGVGMALAGRMDQLPYRVYVVMGDGELAEGSVWEAAMSAAHYKLDSLCAVVDRNGLQISGSTEEVMSQGDLTARWESFGWHVLDVDGHDLKALDSAFSQAEKSAGKPTVIIAHTHKGYGSPLMEDKAAWHHRLPTEEEYAMIISDFARRKAAMTNGAE